MDCRLSRHFVVGWCALCLLLAGEARSAPPGVAYSASQRSRFLPRESRDAVEVDLTPIRLPPVEPPAPEAEKPPASPAESPALERLPDDGAPSADATVRAALGEPVDPEKYTILTAAECQRLGAAHSTMGNLLGGEGQQAANAGCTHSGESTEDSRLRRQMLAYAAQDQRNQSAGQALELYYLKYNAEYGRDAIEKGLAETRQARAYREQIRQQGLDAAQYDGQLDRQHLELESRKVEIHRSIHELDSRLGELLGIRTHGPAALWPETELEILAQPVDADEAVAIGLANRADIRGLEVLVRSINRDTLDTVRAMLGAVNPLLGACPSRLSLLVRIFAHDCIEAQEEREVAIRRRQAQELLADRRRTAEAEIRRAAFDLEQATRRVALAQDTLRSWDERLARLEFQRGLGQGQVSYFDQMEARLHRLQAEGDLVDAMVKWKIAEVKLKQAMGLLVIEAGYGPPC